MTITMYDSTTVGAIPADAAYAAGYVGGKWPTFANGELAARCPKATLLSIAVNAHEDAECLDIEKGDATAQDAPTWNARQVARGVAIPVNYTSVSNVAALLELVPRGSIRLWTAHYTGTPHLCSPACGFGMPTTADATQYDDKALGRNLDASLCSDGFFNQSHPTDPPTHGGQTMFAAPTTRDDFDATLRFLWTTYRNDSFGQKINGASVPDVYWYCYHLPVAQKGFGQSMDLLLASVIDTAGPHLRATFKGAV